MKMKRIFIPAAFMALLLACERIDDDPGKHISDSDPDYIELNEVAQIMSLLPISSAQMQEVYDAVSSSSGNGYDEEYTMNNLFSSPGAGVGESASKAGVSYEQPMRELIENQLRLIAEGATKAEIGQLSVSSTIDRLGVDGFMDALTLSDIQIYWPFSDDWDGEAMPVITFDPEDGSDINVGYRLMVDDDGSCRVEDVLVDEELAKNAPVWVVNRNDDASYTSLEMLRRVDSESGEGGGNLIIRPKSTAEGSGLSSLVLKDFTMKANYDSWFAGASEFFVRIGAVESFWATTEAELKLYNPSITEFMVVVKRNQINVVRKLDVVLVSDWSEQMSHCAFLLTEDDGGTKTSWNCSAIVKVDSKSYGVDISLPFNTRDDIVWRGQLARSWIEANNYTTGHFGDVDITFGIDAN